MMLGLCGGDDVGYGCLELCVGDVQLGVCRVRTEASRLKPHAFMGVWAII